jgi:hypothetical protein
MTKIVSTAILIFFALSASSFASGPVNQKPLIKINLPSAVHRTWIAMHFKVLTMTKQGNTWNWSAIVKNTGPRLQKNRVRVTATQLLVKKSISPAGAPFTYSKAITMGQTMNFGIHAWQRVSSATHLKVEIRDLKSGRMITKTIRMPDEHSNTIHGSNNALSQVEKMGSDPLVTPIHKVVVKGGEYLGRGYFRIKIKNLGNTTVKPNQLKITPIFYTMHQPPIVGKVTTNPAYIKVGSTLSISGGGDGIYYKPYAECWQIQKIEIEVRHTITKQEVYYKLQIPKITGKINRIDMNYSVFRYEIQNTGPYKARFKVRMLSVQINKQMHVDDKEGKKIGVVKNVFHGAITLNAGASGIIEISHQQVNREIMAQIHGMKDQYYNAKWFMAELFTEGDNELCSLGAKVLQQYSVGDVNSISDEIFIP